MAKRFFLFVAAAVLLLSTTERLSAQTIRIGDLDVSITMVDCTTTSSDSAVVKLNDSTDLSTAEMYEIMWTSLIMGGMPFNIMGRSAEMESVAEERARLALERCQADDLEFAAVPLQVWTTYYNVIPESIGTTADEVQRFVYRFFCNVATEELELCRLGKFTDLSDFSPDQLADSAADAECGEEFGNAEALYRLTSGPITYADIGTTEDEVLDLIRQQHVAEVRSVIERCRSGDTTYTSSLDFLLEDYKLTPADVGATEAEVHGYIHADHISRAKILLETCRTDSGGVAMVEWLENYMANTEVKPWEIGTTEAELDSMRKEVERLKQREQQRLEEPKQKL